MSRTLTPKQKLHKKLFEIRRAVKPIVKQGHNDRGEFIFARFEDVAAEASRHMDEKRILIVPEVIDEAIKVFGHLAIAKVAMEFEVIDLSGGGSLKRRWSGTADDDPGGKALFKAQTGCEKYFLAKLLRIPFGTDPEAEEPGSLEHEPGGSLQADHVRAEQDAAAETPHIAPQPRRLRPLPSSDLPEPEWAGSEDMPAEEVPTP